MQKEIITHVMMMLAMIGIFEAAHPAGSIRKALSFFPAHGASPLHKLHDSGCLPTVVLKRSLKHLLAIAASTNG